MSNKKGFTLIEVVVALGILTMAFASAVSLMVAAMNLSMLSRENTEATALMQKGLADGTAAIQTCCLVEAPRNLDGVDTNKYIPTVDPNTGTEIPQSYDLTINGKTITITFGTSAADFNSVGGDISANPPQLSPAINANSYVKLTSKVAWDHRGLPYSIKTIQYVKKGS